MSSYVALIWNRESLEASRFAGKLMDRLKAFRSQVPIVNAEDFYLCLLSEDGKPYHDCTLLDGGGVLVGRVFRRDGRRSSTTSRCSPSPPETNDPGTCARDLVARYWGHYVGFVRHSGTRHVEIVRDPSGAMPCLMTNRHGVMVLFSDIRHCVGLGILEVSVNWSHLARFLCYDRFATDETGLVGVTQLRPGECLSVSENGIDRAFCWNPADVCRARVIESRQRARDELRKCIEECVAAWTSCYTGVLHRLSGGLDSSVVLACLHRAAVRNLVCANHFTPGSEGDERTFARAAASFVGAELVEMPIGSRPTPLSSMLDTAIVATPAHTNLLSESQSALERLVGTRGLQAIFSGQGGDHLFQQGGSIQIAAEYAWRNGFRGGLLTVVEETARLTGRSFWSVLAAAVRYGILRRRVEWTCDRFDLSPLLTAEAREYVEWSPISHPWLEDARSLPGAKFLQIANLIDTQSFYRAPRRYADIVHPLLSLPVVELSLQVPSYVLAYGGIDRALIRDAFADAIPETITRRTAKGATTGYFNRLLIRNLQFVRELLLDGNLAAHGLLDRASTEAVLHESAMVSRPGLLWPLLNAIRAEAWIDSWLRSPREEAA